MTDPIDMAGKIFEAILGPELARLEHAPGCTNSGPAERCDYCSGIRPSPQPHSALKFRDQDIFEMVIAGSQLAYFLLSGDLTECAVCGASGQNMMNAESHHPCCKIGRWWQAVDALKIGLEVRL